MPGPDRQGVDRDDHLHATRVPTRSDFDMSVTSSSEIAGLEDLPATASARCHAYSLCKRSVCFCAALAELLREEWHFGHNVLVTKRRMHSIGRVRRPLSPPSITQPMPVAF